jgi:hypothetical protein
MEFPMALRTLTFLLAASGLAVAVYKLGERSARERGNGLAYDDPHNDALAPLDVSNPNLGEQLQDMKLANAGVGSAANERNEDLLTPPRGDEQQSDAIKPGLPDFARGA